MTSTTGVLGSGGSKEKRRFPRYSVEIPVFLRKKTGDIRLVTSDVSRHGAFIKSDAPHPVRQLVQLRFRLPDHSEIDAMCMVARWLGPETVRGPGMGVDFFALSKDAKNAWERFLTDLRARGVDVANTAAGIPAFQPTPIAPPAPSQPPHPALVSSQPPADVATLSTSTPEWFASNQLTPAPAQPSSQPSSQPVQAQQQQQQAQGQTQQQAHKKLPPPPPPDDDVPQVHTSIVMHRLPDRDAVKAFIDNEIGRGGMFLKTLLVKSVGDKLDVVLVHPDTDEEFHLEGTVVRRIITGPSDNRGLGIFFRALTQEQHAQLLEFAESGIEVVELGVPVSSRQVELEAAVAKEPDSAEALEALGSFLLDEEGDLGGALTALTRALVLCPSQISIHASLARAYRKIGDRVKVRAHERCAEALMLHQGRMKVRLGGRYDDDTDDDIDDDDDLHDDDDDE